ncbi:DUF572-domain-containing protein [Astrocystis sublimbata]|nr:DUF572-domain-containing protein [Astrocystis sublimbata]
MSERKVLSKYYPPDFDPNAIQRSRKPKATGPKVQTVRLMAPFSMKCLRCGEYIYKGRKFNARKETPLDERYLGIQIFRFYIKCTRCSAEICFRTDPKNNDYACEKGAKRNTEPWRVGREETDEERLDRLEQEGEEEEADAMVELEAKTLDAKLEMEVADKLDEIQFRNARVERAERDGLEVSVAPSVDQDTDQQEREDAEAARRAFAAARGLDDLVIQAIPKVAEDASMPPPPLPQNSHGITSKPKVAPTSSSTDTPAPSFKREVKKKTKKNYGAMLGIKQK